MYTGNQIQDYHDKNSFQQQQQEEEEDSFHEQIGINLRKKLKVLH
jgi:hypothetical protein